MHRLIPTLAFALLVGACAPKSVPVRDQLVVEQHRARITKVRHAIDETREVIASSRGAPYLPELYMRLAELTSEEARYHYMVAYEREGGRAEALHLPQVRILKEQAIATYRLILERYPDSHLADRVLFNIGQEQRELGEFDDMRATLEQLVEEHPGSRYRSEALLVLADYHFDQAEFQRARRYYQAIAAQGDTPLLGLATYKLGWVHLNLGDCESALTSFEGAIEASRDAEAARGASQVGMGSPSQVEGEFAVPRAREQEGAAQDYQTLDVQREALVDLTYCYAQVREPEQAAVYLRERAGSREAYVAALRKMARRFALIEQPRGAAEVSRELLRLAADDEERLDDARLLHSVVTRMDDYSAVGEDTELILRAMRRQAVRPDHDVQAQERLAEEFELLARDLATRSHRALRGEIEPGEWEVEPPSAEQTTRAYQAYLASFPDSESQLEVVHNLADVLMEGERYLEAGHRYREVALLIEEALTYAPEEAPPAAATEDEAVEGEPAEPVRTAGELREEREQVLYDAAVAYQRGLEAAAQGSRLERTLARAGLRDAGGKYLLEAEAEPDRALRIKYSIGRSYYEEGAYLQAIDLLTAVAYEYPGTEQGDAAAHLVLDSYNTINDISGLLSVGQRFLADESPIAQGVKAEIEPIVAMAEQRRLDDLSLAASGDRAGGMEVLLAFADRYKDSDLGERALLGTFVAARASGDAEMVYSIGEQLLQRFPESEQVSGVASTMGQTAASRYEFDRSVEFLEMAADLSKDPRQQVALLLTAGELREQLADAPGAEKAYRRALDIAGDARARSEAGAHLANLVEQWQSFCEVVRVLEPLAEPFDPEIASRLGLAMLRTGRSDEAELMLLGAVDSAVVSSPALARANYGMAEIMLQALEEFEPLPELYAIEEAAALVEIAVQSYLAAARQADPAYAQAALARLARTAELGATKLEQIQLPPDLADDERALVQDALAQRITALRAGRDDALAHCAERARTSYRMDAAGRACLAGTAPVRDPIEGEALARRVVAADPPGLDEARARLSRNPDDLEALREVGAAYLDAGDVHAARVVLGHIAGAGGDATDLVRLGEASKAVGDLTGAMNAWGRAMDAGSADGAERLAALYDELGLGELAAEVRGGVSR